MIEQSMGSTATTRSNFEPHKSFSLPDKTYLGIVKRDISKLVENVGFDDVTRGKIDIVVSEMASNLVKHAIAGELLVKLLVEGEVYGVEIISVDAGPGMHHPMQMMQDGISTYGSKGEGLGAMKRLSDEFNLYSHPGVGTTLLSRLFKKGSTPKSKLKLDIGAVRVSYKGDPLCGDAWVFGVHKSTVTLLAADGLGHGEFANEASEGAVNALLKEASLVRPSVLLRNLHQSIRKTRGAVIGIGQISLADNTLTYCGVGNIGGKIIQTDTSKNLLSYNGTVGYIIPNHMNDHVFDWGAQTVFVMHSDGVKSRWDFTKYPGLNKCDSTVIAATLYKDNGRATDDTLVVVAKNK